METHILFFIFAGLLLMILVGASIWSARREKSRIFSNTFSTRPPSSPINTGLTTETLATFAKQGLNPQTTNHNESPFNDNLAQAQRQEIEQSISNIKISLPGEEQAVFSETESAYTAQTTPQNTPTEQQLVSDETPIQIPLAQQPLSHTETMPTDATQTIAHEPQIITLYVVAAEGQQFYGNAIIQHLENLGFQYGEYQIFHRHLDNSSSPVLFSVANMMQPGILDLNTIDQFTTVGLTFFMQLPSVGNDLANLRLMIRTVESFAQSIGGFVLNEQHQLFDDETRQAYLLRLAQ